MPLDSQLRGTTTMRACASRFYCNRVLQLWQLRAKGSVLGVHKFVVSPCMCVLFGWQPQDTTHMIVMGFFLKPLQPR